VTNQYQEPEFNNKPEFTEPAKPKLLESNLPPIYNPCNFVASRD